jgi:hypothetical protein
MCRRRNVPLEQVDPRPSFAEFLTPREIPWQPLLAISRQNSNEPIQILLPVWNIGYLSHCRKRRLLVQWKGVGDILTVSNSPYLPGPPSTNMTLLSPKFRGESLGFKTREPSHNWFSGFGVGASGCEIPGNGAFSSFRFAF